MNDSLETMQSFGWKRKSIIEKDKLNVFSTQDESDEDIQQLQSIIKKKVKRISETVEERASRLKQEGVIFASSDKWWSAIDKWNAVVSLRPDDHTVHEMLAQAYLQVYEIFPAVKSSESATKCNPMWWPSQQTLGRSLLGIGEVKLAIKAFSRAILLNPAEMELWKDDLSWSVTLLYNQLMLDYKKQQSSTKQHRSSGSLQIVELDDDIIDLQQDTVIFTASIEDQHCLIEIKKLLRGYKHLIKKFESFARDNKTSVNNTGSVNNMVQLRVNR